MNEIEVLINHFVASLAPEKVYLFGSFANETYTDNSDIDFYIVVNDDETDMASISARAYKAIRKVKRRPVDILVGTNSRFEARKTLPSIEKEVYEKGALIYESRNRT